MDVTDLQPLELFSGLGTEQLEELIAAGREVPFAPGDLLWTEGEHADSWWVVVDGVVGLTVVDGVVVGLGVLGVAVSHRTGLLEVGAAAIVAAVSTAHRTLAFDVCARLVENHS